MLIKSRLVFFWGRGREGGIDGKWYGNLEGGGEGSGYTREYIF